MTFQNACGKSIGFVFFMITVFVICSLVVAYFSGYYGGDLITYGMVAGGVDLFFLVALYVTSSVVFFIVFWVVFYFSSRMRILPKINHEINPFPIHVVVFFIIVFSFAVVYFTPTGTILRDGQSIRELDVIFAFIQPFYFSIIYFFVYSSSVSRLYKINFVIFALACVLSGFVGYIFFLVPLLLKNVVSRVGYRGLFFAVVVATLLLPFLHIYKFKLKYGLSISEFVDIMDFDMFLAFFRSIIDRFNYLPNVLFIMDNEFFFEQLLGQSSYQPYYQGYFGSLVHKAVFSSGVNNLQGEVSFLINGVYRSNATFPIASYFFTDKVSFFFVLLYVIFLMVFLALLLSRYYVDNNVVRYPFFVLSFVFLLQGWFWPYVNFLQAGVIFYFVVLFFRGLVVQWNSRLMSLNNK